MIVKRPGVIDAVEVASNHTVIVSPRSEGHQNIAMRTRKAIGMERVSGGVIVDNPKGYGPIGRHFENERIVRVIPGTLPGPRGNVEFNQSGVLRRLSRLNRNRVGREVLSGMRQLIAVC